ncbi:MAG TPA: hypothetical protein VHE83_08425 [Mycobacteriales bacterium]|nr:hypothetical protein [Mycobacteriales bacterium]
MTVAVQRAVRTDGGRLERFQRRAAETVVERERARRAQGDVEVLPTGSMPWHVRDVQRLLVTLLLAAIGLTASWVGISGTVIWSRQMLWLAIGIASTAVAAVAVMTWLLTAFRAVRVRQSRMVDGIAARLVLDDEPDAADAAGPGAAELVSAPSMTRFHRADCPLVQGRPTTPLTAARRARLSPCGVCRPIASSAELP